MKEIWKDLKNYEGLYQISNFGRIKSFYKHKNGKILKTEIRNTYEVCLRKKYYGCYKTFK